MKARLIVTERCVRSCPHCCNKHPHIVDAMQPLGSIGDLAGCDEIMVTGGEPTLVPSVTENVLRLLRKHVPGARLYLYSARYTAMVSHVLRHGLVDGVTYTIHDGADGRDIEFFEDMQLLALGHGYHASLRLKLGPHIARPIPIVPRAWSEIRVTRWRTEKPCCVPEGHLFYLENEKVPSSDA